jgi:hypothetical protein
MKYTSVLKKMQTEHSSPIQYYLDTDNSVLNVNQLIGKQLDISFEHFQCMGCGKDKKLFRNGFCYDCFYKLPQAADWIIKPELSKAHLGIEDRDLEYEKKMQLKPHIVYLANSSNIKVGVTRKNQVPTRWIDQGAHEALEIVEVPNRYLAGVAEVALKEFVSDKTNWRKMLTNTIEDVNLEEWRDKLQQYLPKEVQEYFIANNKETNLNFPITKYPVKVKSLNLEKTPFYSGKLAGIKGQYLLFEDGTVFNVRSHEGHVVQLTIV